MGGINQGNIAQVVARGARHPAVMSAVTAAPDISAAARALREAIVSRKRKLTPGVWRRLSRRLP